MTTRQLSQKLAISQPTAVRLAQKYIRLRKEKG